MLAVIVFKTFGGSEAIVTLSFVHGINEWKSGNNYDVLNTVILMIPLLTNLITEAFGLKIETFSDFLEPLHFYNVGYGVGSNLWGSMYSMGGIIATALAMYFYLLSFYLFFIYSKSRYVSTHLIFPVMMLLSFYATRWELAALIYIFLASCFCYLVLIAFKNLLQTRSSG